MRYDSDTARRAWPWVRAGGGLAILALLAWRLGGGPFLDGLRGLDPALLAATFGIGVLTTVCCAWRWSLVAAGLGIRLPLPRATAAYYRSQFLNTTLPGGVLGDVHRAMWHGQAIRDVRLAVRAVVVERFAGSVVQTGVALGLLMVLPSPVRSHVPGVVAVVAVAVVAVAVVVVAVPRSRASRWLRGAWTDLRRGVVSGGQWVGVGLASVVVVAGHLATFVLAARTAGVTAPLALLVPLTLLTLLAMTLPLNVAGWGPREGVAAWAFAAAGLTSAQGVATAVTYGVVVLAASLPGAAVLVGRWLADRAGFRRLADRAGFRRLALGDGRG
jgi:uncharacterized membrane protein YbhN (UPF0104 family)